MSYDYDYFLVMEMGNSSFQAAVNARLDEGWEPHGPVHEVVNAFQCCVFLRREKPRGDVSSNVKNIRPRSDYKDDPYLT